MNSPPTDSPYPVGSLVRDPELLQLRRWEIDRGLEIVASGGGGEHRHAALIGDPHSGRTSVLVEVARRAMKERKRLVVHLHGGDGIALSRSELVRHLLTAVVEALSAKSEAETAWYRSWRNRVYLRDASRAGPNDLLSGALMLAANPEAQIDRPVLERDLQVLAELGRESDFEGIVICIDDASPLTEDISLMEELVDVFDSVGSYSLLLSGLPAVADHFMEAASRCLDRLQPVWLEPFYSPPQILTALTVPLSAGQAKYVESDNLGFVLDLLTLTAGNPFELMVVANYLWLSCECGEQESYALTPRLLDRIIPHLALRANDGDALRDGAQAIDCLPEEQVQGALELAGLSRLTVREIAVNRLLKDANGHRVPPDRKPSDILDHLDEEEERVKADLTNLEENGIVQVHPDGECFSIVGGRPASVLLKYKARARIGSSLQRPFGQNFLHAVGQPLARNLVRSALEEVPDAASLGFTVAGSDRGIGSRSPRPALRSLSASGDIARLIRSEAEVVPWDADAHRKITALVASDDARVALVCTSINYGRGELEYMELWQVPVDTSDQAVSEALGAISESWQPLVAAADLTWRGVDSAVVSGAAARKVVCVLRPFSSGEAVMQQFGAWRQGEDASGLARAIRSCQEVVDVMRASDQTDLELGGELSRSLSRLGFLQSFDDDKLAEARSSLEDAQRTGDADDWVTDWNLANIFAREGDLDAALDQLDKVAESVVGERWASLLFYVPGRGPSDSLLDVNNGGVEALIALQRVVLEGDDDASQTAIQAARDTEDEGAVLAAEWVEEASAQLALETSGA